MGYMDLDLTNEKRILSRAAQRQNPVNGSMELLPLCNMNCEMCYIRLNKKEVEEQGGLHDVEEWTQLGNEMAEAGVLFLLLTGGEPLMFSGFQRLYQELKRLGMILTINTNGTLLDKGWADFFAAYKGVNRYAILYVIFGTLNSKNREKISDEESNKQRTVWIKRENLKDFLTVNNNLFVSNFLLDGDCAYEGDGIMINSEKFNGKLRSEIKAILEKQKA